MQDQPKSLGKYAIKKKIGAGGMGSVFLATDTDLNRIVALKILPREKAENPTLVKRFRSEAQAAAQLRHDNIVTVYEAGEIDGHLYIALEYVEGIDVYELIVKRGIVPVKRSVEIVKQVTRALQHAGTTGIVHRDIKPSNLLIRRDGICKLTDLGLARSIDETTETAITRAGTTVGTVDYMSPEQARDSKAADIRSDIYSLGCTWFHMLTGKPPFAEGSVTNKLHAHAVKPPPDPREDNPSVPDGLVAVMHRMMAKSPGDRYQSPTELLEDLERTSLTQAAVSTDVLAGLASDSDHDEPEPTPTASTGQVTRIERYAKKKKKKKSRDKDREPAARWESAEDEDSFEAPDEKNNKNKSRRKSKRAAAGRSDDAAGPEGGPGPPPPPGKGRALGKAVAAESEEGGFDWEVLKYVGGAVAVAGLIVLIWISSTRLAATFTDPGVTGANAGGAGEKGLARSSRPKPAPPEPKEVPQETPPPAPPEDPVTPVTESELEIGRLGDRVHFPAWVDSLAKPIDFDAGDSIDGLPIVNVGKTSGDAAGGDLSHALEQVGDSGAAIRLQGEGPFFLRPVRITATGPLIISSDQKSRPLVYCHAGESQSADSVVLNKSGGSLSLLGLDIVVDGSTFSSGNELGVVAADDCDLVVRNCSLTVTGNADSAVAFLLKAESSDSQAPKVLMDRLFLRGDRVGGLFVETPALDLLAVNSLLACGAAPFVRFGNVVAETAGATGETGESAARRLRLLSCTLCTGTDGFALDFDRPVGDPPSTELFVFNTLVSSTTGSDQAALFSLGRWPAGIMSQAALGSPKDLHVAAEASAFLGWPTLVSSQSTTMHEPADLKQWWPGLSDQAEFDSEAWPASLTDVAAAKPVQFDPAGIAGLDVEATDEGRPGCLFESLNSPSVNSLARAVALLARPSWPALSQAGPVVPVDLEKEDLGRVVGRDDWEDGTVFELAGAGYVFSTPLVVNGKSLTLRFAGSTEETLTLQPKLVARGTPFISISGGTIRIEKGTFKVPASRRPTIPARFLQVTDGSFSLEDCYVRGPMLTSPHFQGLIEWTQSPTPEHFGRIENSFLTSIEPVVEAEMQGQTLLIKNSVLVSLGDLFVFGGETTPSVNGVVDVRNSTLSSVQAYFNVASSPPQSGPHEVLRVFVDETVFAPQVMPAEGTPRPVVLTLAGSDSPLAFVDWWENRNGYAVEVAEYLREGEAGDTQSPQSFDNAWVDVWGRDRVNQSIAGRGDVMLADALPAPSDVEPGNFRLHPVSTANRWAEDGGAIGADLASVQGEPVQPQPQREPAKKPIPKSKSRGGTRPKF